MKIEQFFDKGLAHLSYAILSEGEVALIDPARDPKPYYQFAQKNKATIKAVIETHPHADFISSHAEIAKKGAKVYISSLAGAKYAHVPFDDGDILKIGKVSLKSMLSPGHSPDSISVLLLDEQGKEHAVFTGDTLFIGDVGRPDLRESAGNTTAKKEMLARQMYHSLRDKLMKLADNTIVYPAHGAGSLCGKSMSQELSGTIKQQKFENYALQEMDEAQFVQLLLENQPSIPKYFPYDVSLNREGAPSLEESIKQVNVIASSGKIEMDALVIDTRPEKLFKSGHIKGAINIQNGGKFETWLGSIVSPDEKFYLIALDESELKDVIYKAAKIGYELNIKGALAQHYFNDQSDELLNLEKFTENTSAYTIVDVRDHSEVKAGKKFEQSIHIPLSELRERKNEIPSGKPIVVHCAGGYRSAAGSSILNDKKEKIYDLSENIKKFETINLKK
ncbi:MAG: MBL fold metallo-hydrolase [Cytophagaceae bacterium]|nr:MBL fold metallo-hydrolase [Cytophagaceae bacterium]